MRQFYLDTNVFISALKPDDPYHSDAGFIMKGMKKETIRAETSVFTILEVASVLGRLYHSRHGGKGSERERKLFVVRAVKRLGELKMKFVNVAGDGPSPVRGVQATLPSIFNEAILLSLRSTLRTLDLIHLAAARHAKLMNLNLGAFVTGDSEFLSDKRRLSEIVGMPILSPKEYVAGLRPGSRPKTVRGGLASDLVRAQRDERENHLSR